MGNECFGNDDDFEEKTTTTIISSSPSKKGTNRKVKKIAGDPETDAKADEEGERLVHFASNADGGGTGSRRTKRAKPSIRRIGSNSTEVAVRVDAPGVLTISETRVKDAETESKRESKRKAYSNSRESKAKDK
jgi:hypothetical protein